MKNSLKFKKTTRISWNSWNSHELFPVSLGLPKMPIMGRGSFLGFDFGPPLIQLSGISAVSSNGKTGLLNLAIGAHHNQSPLMASELQSIANGLYTRNSAKLKFRTPPKSQHEPFSFDLWVPNGAGFCETVIESVSDIASFLGVNDDRWFKAAMKIEQTTHVLIDGVWVEYGAYLTDKFPIYRSNDGRKPILYEGGIEV